MDLKDYIAYQSQISKIADECTTFFWIQKTIHPSLEKEMCYVGVTNDVEVRDGQHQAKHFWKHECESAKMALDVEKELASRGYDAGKEQGHGQGDSTWVYAYIKTAGTRENTAGPDYKDPSKQIYRG